MASGDIKLAYATSVSATVTNLHSLPTSATWVAGWSSADIDNTTNLYEDVLVQAIVKVAAAGLSVGEIRLYAVAESDDTTWPDVITGSEATKTFTNTNMRDAVCRLLCATTTATTANLVYPLSGGSVAAAFGGSLPRKFVLFIAHSTGANLAASGNAVYTKGVYRTVAP